MDEFTTASDKLKAAHKKLRAAATRLENATGLTDQTLVRDVRLLAEESLDLVQQAKGLEVRAEAERSATES